MQCHHRQRGRTKTQVLGGPLHHTGGHEVAVQPPHVRFRLPRLLDPLCPSLLPRPQTSWRPPTDARPPALLCQRLRLLFGLSLLARNAANHRLRPPWHGNTLPLQRRHPHGAMLRGRFHPVPHCRHHLRQAVATEETSAHSAFQQESCRLLSRWRTLPPFPSGQHEALPLCGNFYPSLPCAR